jgi:hypothetical protein
VQDPGHEDREDRHTRTDARTDTDTRGAQDDDEARAEEVEELAQQMGVANNCTPPRPGDAEY